MEFLRNPSPDGSPRMFGISSVICSDGKQKSGVKK